MLITSRIGKSLPVWRLSFGNLIYLFHRWRHRARSRRQLLRLDERQLQDIGIDRRAAEEEARKPFWCG